MAPDREGDSVAGPGERSLQLRVSEAPTKDVGRALVRIDPAQLAELGLQVGDTAELIGKRRAIGKVMPMHRELRGQGRIQMDGITRQNAGVGLDELVQLRPLPTQPAERLDLVPTTVAPTERDLDYIGRLLDGLPVLEQNLIRVTLFGSRAADFRVEATVPKGAVLITPLTKLRISAAPKAEPSRAPSYEDIGGLGRQLQRIREMIELPLRYPQVFARLGIDPPKGVLLHGPPGCGKTLIARTIAREVDANFFAINGPEIIHKFYGESEAHLRKIFDEASRKGPSIIFLDEIDAIAPSRERVVGDVEKRVVAQLLALMDGLNQRTHVIVIAATNLPGALDPALRRPGRFDREISIPIPDRRGRQQILEIHSRGMPLHESVDVGRLAEVTHGFVGADLSALCREAAMLCLRRIIDDIDFARAAIPYDQLARLEVSMADFQGALREVEPSALREVFTEVPSVTWSDVGGQDAVKQSLIEAVVWPLKYPQHFSVAGLRPAKGVLLAGPPGCGKTLLAKAAATECGVNFISIKGPALLSKFVGDSERAVRDLFRTARQAAPCIVFLDEMDALLPVRSAGGFDSRVSDRVIGQFLTELDGVEELSGVLVLGATNRPDLIDPAILRPGRFDSIISIPYPEAQARREILQIHLRNLPRQPDCDLEPLVALTAGQSGAELAAICQVAARAALRRAIEHAAPAVDEPRLDAGALQITSEDLLAAARQVIAAATRSAAPAA